MQVYSNSSKLTATHQVCNLIYRICERHSCYYKKCPILAANSDIIGNISQYAHIQ